MDAAEALERWRIHRHPVLAELVRHLDADRTPRKAPRGVDDFDALWIGTTAAPSDDDLGWLAETLVTKVPSDGDVSVFDRDFVPRRYHALFRRLELLADLEPDPRVAFALANVVLEGKLSCGYGEEFVRQLYGPMLDLIEAIGDTSVIPVLERARDAPRSPLRTVREGLPPLVRSTIERLSRSRYTTPDDLPALRERLRPRAAAQDPAELLAAVLQDPLDLELREVYADVLQQNGDPRGTFIALQLDGDEASAKKAAKILRRHRSEWLGPLLDRVLTKPEFSDGFLAKAHIAGNPRANEDEWAQAPYDERLATVEELWQGSSNVRNYVGFLVSPVLRALVAFEVPNRAAFEAVIEGPNVARAQIVQLRFRPTPQELEAVATAMPVLEELVFKTSRSAREKQERAVAGLRERGVQIEMYGG